MKIAIVHDQLQEFGGAERVLVALKQAYPEADVYTAFYNPQQLGIHAKLVKNWHIKTSWSDKVWLFKRFYSPLRFLTPLIWEPLDFSEYDLVISSSGSYMCKGIITKPKTKHICYLHHPPRSLYYYETALEWQRYWPIRIYGHLINHKLRIWDYLSSQRVDHFIANSEETKGRIKKFYRHDAEVVYPPVMIPDEITLKPLAERKYYITVSRLARAKHIEVLIQAANKYHFPLVVIGTGRDEQYLKSIAKHTVTFAGSVTDEQLTEYYQNAKAFLFASVDEEFGIAPIEAMGYGLPVIAYASGGLKETIEEGKNGYLYHELDADSLQEKLHHIETASPERYEMYCEAARESSKQYSQQNFISGIHQAVSRFMQ